MSTPALLILIALVASIDGDRAVVGGELLQYLRPGDVGQICYELKVAEEVRTIDVGTAKVLSVEGDQAEVQLTSDREVRPGFAVRFEVPLERLRAEGLQAQLDGERQAREAALAEVEELQAKLDEERQARQALAAELVAAGTAGDSVATRLGQEQRARAAAGAELEAIQVKLETAVARQTELEQSLEGTRAELAAERELRAETAPPPAEAAPATEAAPLPTPGQLEARVRAWAEAWSRQDVDAYLSFYAAAYQPHGMSRRQWEARRSERLRAPEFIEVAVDDFDLRSSTSERAEVRFEQSYRSDTFQDRVTKTLELVLIDGEWKISLEEAR